MADDVITRDRPVAKYLWLIYVRERTKWTSCKVRDVDGSSVPLIIALKSSNSSRMNSNFSFCKNPIQLQLLSTVLSAIYWIKFYSFYRKSENGALSLNIATSIKLHVPFSLSPIIISVLSLWNVLFLHFCSFSNMGIFPSIQISQFFTLTYQSS